jgi:hypothetical protein
MTIHTLFKNILPKNIIRIFITKIIFVENQLSLILISLSPLITNHLRILQHSRVQSLNKLVHN